jgi:hypothetical protein
VEACSPRPTRTSRASSGPVEDCAWAGDLGCEETGRVIRRSAGPCPPAQPTEVAAHRRPRTRSAARQGEPGAGRAGVVVLDIPGREGLHLWRGSPPPPTVDECIDSSGVRVPLRVRGPRPGCRRAPTRPSLTDARLVTRASPDEPGTRNEARMPGGYHGVLKLPFRRDSPLATAPRVADTDGEVPHAHRAKCRLEDPEMAGRVARQATDQAAPRCWLTVIGTPAHGNRNARHSPSPSATRKARPNVEALRASTLEDGTARCRRTPARRLPTQG